MQKPLRFPELPEDHIANIQVGEEVSTPKGTELCVFANKFRFSTRYNYNQVGYWENNNSKTFKRILR